MKRCPECMRDYFDDSLTYCLDDGAVLLEGPRTDDQITRIMPDIYPDTPTRIMDAPTTAGGRGAVTSSGIRRTGKGLYTIVGLVILVLLAGSFAVYRYIYQ